MLPVQHIADSLRAAVAARDRARVLLKAPTGSGKSTLVPGMLRDAGLDGRILVVEPRRMAARLLAGWVAKWQPLADAAIDAYAGALTDSPGLADRAKAATRQFRQGLGL